MSPTNHSLEGVRDPDITGAPFKGQTVRGVAFFGKILLHPLAALRTWGQKRAKLHPRGITDDDWGPRHRDALLIVSTAPKKNFWIRPRIATSSKLEMPSSPTNPLLWMVRA